MDVPVIAAIAGGEGVVMVRWQPDARSRLEQAAMRLFRERGFDEVTVVEIAAQAGLTDRTFFRHFADKREILFSGQQALGDVFVQTIANEPASAAPVDVVAAALRAVAEAFFAEGRREIARQRQAIVDSDTGLRERDLLKRAFLADAIAGALRERGVGDLEAALAAEMGTATFKIAFARWIAGAPETLWELIDETLAALSAAVANPPGRVATERP